MKHTFTREFFAGNRRRLVELLDMDAPIVLTANGLLQRNADATYKFRQDASFWYVTGIDEPDIVLVIDGAEEYLILPGRDAVREAFDGAVTADSLIEKSGIEQVFNIEDGWKKLGETLRHAKRVATPEASPAYVERHGLYVNPARGHLAQRLHEANPNCEIVDIREQLAGMRVVKQPVELAAIQQAIDVTIDGLLAVTAPGQLATYKHEYEAEADLTREFRRHGHHHAFEPIVASGHRACQLHYVSNNGPLKAGELLIFDVGAEADMYAADISRTVVVGSGKPTPRQQQIFDAVCKVQDVALSLLKPGTELLDYEKQIEQAMGEQLQRLGLIETIDHDAVRRYYPHATSHFLGLDVHDVGDYHLPLAAGMVLTCEPGIYIPEEGIGVRIEDDVLITADGHEVLSRRMPRQLRP